MPTSNRVLYRNTLIADFFAELNFMAGVPNARHPDRLRFTGEVEGSLHAAIVRMDILRAVAPYNGSMQLDRIHAAAMMATTLYGAAIDQLTPDQVKRYAIAGVDRILEYLSGLKPRHWSKTWVAHNYLKGLVLGDARRWVTAVPDHVLDGQVPDLQPTASHLFYAISSEEQQAELEQLLESRARVYSVASLDVAILDMNSYRRETSNALHDMVEKFIGVMRQHFVALEYPPLPRPMSSATLLANSVRLSGGGSERHFISSQSHNSLLDSPSKRSVFSISNRDTMDYCSITSEDAVPEQAVMDQQTKIALMALQARLHRLILRRPLRLEEKTKLTRNLQALLPANRYAVAPNIHNDTVVQSLADYLQDYLRLPSGTGIADYFFPKTIHPLLIHGDAEVSRALLFGTLQRHLTTSAQPWLPILIRLQDVAVLAINSNEPFLPQYFSKGLGYTTDGVANLKAHYSFVFFFDGLDQCLDQALVQRIYFGEETAEWQAKLLFTARKGWSPPTRHNALPVKRVNLDQWNLEQSEAFVVAPWQEELADTENSLHAYQHQFLLENPSLLELAQAFTDPDQDAHTVMSALSGKLEPNFGISPVLLTILYDLLPRLRKTDPALWPTNRHQLYDFGLRHYLGEHYDTAYPKIRDLALTLFQQGASAVSERPGTEEAAPYNFCFLSGSMQQQAGTLWHRYVFTQTSWRDYLIAEAMWQACYRVDVQHTDSPEHVLWNQQDCLKDYPGVIDFLSEFLQTSDSAFVDLSYLKKQWVANGALVSWENAHANAKALVDRIESTLSFQRSTVALLQDDYELRPYESPDLTPTAEQQVVTKTRAKDNFIFLTPNRAMRIIESVDRQQSMVKRWIFDSLGHGAGISPTTPTYETAVDRQDPCRDKRRYMACNHLDAQIGEKLLQATFAYIAAGNHEGLEQLVPNYWGLYSRETRFKVSLLQDAIDIDQAKLAYFALLQPVVLTQTLAQAIANLKAFKATRERWLEQQLLAYKSQCQTDGGWFTRDGVHVDQADAKAIAKRVKYYRATLKVEINALFDAISEELQPKPIRKHYRETATAFALRTADYTRKQGLTDKAKIKALAAFCSEIEMDLQANEPRHRTGILELHRRNADLINGTMARFSLLMQLNPITAEVLEAYSAGDRAALLTEITTGDLAAVIERFKPHYLQSFYASKENNLQAIIGEALKTQFLTWLAGQEDSRLSGEWAPLQRQWQSNSARNTTRKAQFLDALETLDLTCALALLKEIVKLSEPMQAIVEQIARQLLEFSVTTGIEAFMAQDLATSNAWQVMPRDEKQAFYQCVYRAFSCEEPDEHALVLIGKSYPQLFAHFTDDFLIRYLRFGMAVDACSIDSQETLLFYALIELGKREEAMPMIDSDPLFKVIQYLFNTGASIFIQSTAITLKTPLDYVNYQCQNHPDNARWIKIKTAMLTVTRIFHEKHEVTEKALVDLSEDLDDVVSHYRETRAAEQQGKEAYVPYLAYSKRIDEHRTASIDTYGAKAQAIKKDLFYLDDNITNLKAEASNFPSFIFSSRLGAGILKGVKRFEEKSSPPTSVWSLQNWSFFGKNSTNTSRTTFSGSGGLFGASGTTISAREQERMEQTARENIALKKQIAIQKEEIADKKGRITVQREQIIRMTILANGETVEVLGQEYDIATVPASTMISAPMPSFSSSHSLVTDQQGYDKISATNPTLGQLEHGSQVNADS